MGNNKFSFLFEKLSVFDRPFLGGLTASLPKNVTEFTTFDWYEFENTLLDKAVEIGLNLVMAIIIIVIGFLIIAIISKIFMAIARKRKWNSTFVVWLDKGVTILLKVLVLILALNRLGVDMSTVTGLVAAAGIAFSAALGNVIPNFVCGVALMIMKPLRVGDWAAVSGCEGVVEELGMVNVHLCAWNNTIYIVPNSTVFNSVVTNFSRRSKRRLDILITIPYTEDLDAVRDVIMSTLKANKLVLEHPRPFINVEDITGSRITLSVNPWISKPEDPFSNILFMWDVREKIIQDMRAAHLRFGCDCLKVECHMGDQVVGDKNEDEE